MEDVIFQLLLSLGFNPKHKGFLYVTEGLIYYVNQTNTSFGEIYQHIANKHGISKQTVMKCMKNAIDGAIMRRFCDEMQFMQNEDSGSVSVSRFISYYGDTYKNFS